MKTEHLKLLNEAKKLYSEKNIPEALEHFKTLLTLLVNERQVSPSDLKEINSYIKKIEDPLGFAQEDLIARTRLTVPALKKSANVIYKKKQFDKAVLEYQKLVEVLRMLPETHPSELADAIWNVGTAYESWAVRVKAYPVYYKKLLTQAKVTTEQAKSLYPVENTNDHTVCEATLERLNFALNSIVDEPSETKLSVEDNLCESRQEQSSIALTLDLALALSPSGSDVNQPIPCEMPCIQTYLNIYLTKVAHPRSLKDMAPSDLPPKKRYYFS